MFLCYIDESGTSNIPGNTSHYILSGISIPVDKWKDCDSDVTIEKSKFGLKEVELHTAWILRPYIEENKINNFKSLDYDERRIAVNQYRKRELLRLVKTNKKQYTQTKKNYRQTDNYVHLTFKERKKLITNISGIIGNWNFARLFAECIDKIYFDPSIGNQSTDEQAFEQVVSRYERFLQITSIGMKNLGMLIHDNNPTVSKKMTHLMNRFHEKGTLWTKITNIIETPLFVDSQLTSMVQIADLCSYALRRYFENNETYLFSNIFKRADRKDGKVVGIRHFTKNSCTCKICGSH
jgi:hypothetical protein